MKKMQFLLVWLAVCSLANAAMPQINNKKAVIFDIGGVLAKPDKVKSFTVTGPHHFARFFLYNITMIPGASEKVRCQLLYPFLRNCLPYDHSSCPVYDEYHERLPQIMVEWMTGRMSCSLIRAICKEKSALYSSWFSSRTERDLMHAMTAMMFTPDKLVQTQKFIQKSVDFVRECKKNGYKVYILSNWDPESFGDLEKKDPVFFGLFDGKVVSGRCGYIKPQQQIYEHLLASYQLEPNDCFFIDDVMHNVQAARACGITAAQCTGCDIDTVKPAFDAWHKA